ncbi:hypothetical protein, partial [Rhizocola hellebori]|uniref:hypothetical protein n=1 Tax=Rhizocola hellebori TaxID=1392758 RepID=UPI00194425C0
AGWLFPYNGRAYVESGDVYQMLAGNLPEKTTGGVDFAGSRDKGPQIVPMAGVASRPAVLDTHRSIQRRTRKPGQIC